MQLAANQYPLSTPGNEIPSTDYLDNNGKKINPVLWAIRQLHAANVTVVRLFAAGTDPTFAMIQKPGTAGADGKTWPNGALNFRRGSLADNVQGEMTALALACMPLHPGVSTRENMVFVEIAVPCPAGLSNVGLL